VRQYESARDFNTKGEQYVIERWLAEIQAAGTWQSKWEDQSRAIVERYKAAELGSATSSFNVLHSNVETQRPMLYSNRPEPDVRRRGKMPGKLDRTAAEILERSLRFMNDTHPVDDEIDLSISDLLLAGRMTMRVRYTPTKVKRVDELTEEPDADGVLRFYTAEGNEVPDDQVIRHTFEPAEGEPYEGAGLAVEELIFERADIESVPYTDFRHQPAKRWRDVGWVAFRHMFTRDELRDAFGIRGSEHRCSMTHRDENAATQAAGPEAHDIWQRCEVWEIWNKPDREVLFVSSGNETEVLGKFKDGPEFYDLEDFFPCPPPLRAITSPDSLLPVPEFVIYQDLANELDEITAQIREIVSTIDVRGAFDATVPELADIFDSSMRLTSIENWQAKVADRGGLSAIMDFIPIKDAAEAFIALVQQRATLLDTIYQVLGLGDISRGDTDPRETFGAQRLKSQSASRRMTTRQRNVQRYLRDLLRIQAELIAKFEPDTLALMTGIDPEEALPLLRNDALRSFAVDVETDSTVAGELDEQLARIAELLEGLAGFANAAAAIPEGARMPLLLSITRKMRLGRDVEAAFEEAAENPEPPQPDAQELKAINDGERLELDRERAQNEYLLGLAELAQKARELDLSEDQAEADVIQALAAVFSDKGDRNARPAPAEQ